MSYGPDIPWGPGVNADPRSQLDYQWQQQKNTQGLSFQDWLQKHNIQQGDLTNMMRKFGLDGGGGGIGGGYGGGSPLFNMPPQYGGASSMGAINNAYSTGYDSARVRTEAETKAALSGLRGQMAGRGMAGSGIAAGGMGAIYGQAQQGLTSVANNLAQEKAGRAGQIEDRDMAANLGNQGRMQQFIQYLMSQYGA